MELPLSRSRAGDVLLAAGEATSNAIEHAYRGRVGEVRLIAYVTDNRLIIEVRDGGHWRNQSSDDRGRGLAIMRSLVDSVSIESTHQGTAVRLEVLL